MPHSRKASNSSLINSGKRAPVSAWTCAKKVSSCSKDHLIQRRFFRAPTFVVGLVCSRRGRKRLAHDRFLLLFCWTVVIYSIMVMPSGATTSVPGQYRTNHAFDLRTAERPEIGGREVAVFTS